MPRPPGTRLDRGLTLPRFRAACPCPRPPLVTGFGTVEGQGPLSVRRTKPPKKRAMRHQEGERNFVTLPLQYQRCRPHVNANELPPRPAMLTRRRDACCCSWTLVVAMMGLFGIATSATAQNLGAVTGSVVDAADRAPLIGAKVTLEKLDAPTDVRTTRTASDGTFQFARVQPGQYVLEVSYLGYQERQVPMTIEIGESRDLDLTLQLDTLSLGTTVEAPSRRRQRLLEAPASVSVLEPIRIRREAMTSSVEALRATGGVDVAQTGVDRRAVALRGFNSAFSDAPHVRTDHREAEAPVLVDPLACGTSGLFQRAGRSVPVSTRRARLYAILTACPPRELQSQRVGTRGLSTPAGGTGHASAPAINRHPDARSGIQRRSHVRSRALS